MAIVDFTNPEACAWYKAKLRTLLEMGVDSFKTDFGERIPTDVVYYDGSDPDKCTITILIFITKWFLSY